MPWYKNEEYEDCVHRNRGGLRHKAYWDARLQARYDIEARKCEAVTLEQRIEAAKAYGALQQRVE